jgi:hypothetical protein
VIKYYVGLDSYSSSLVDYFDACMDNTIFISFLYGPDIHTKNLFFPDSMQLSVINKFFRGASIGRYKEHAYKGAASTPIMNRSCSLKSLKPATFTSIQQKRILVERGKRIQQLALAEI